ncbi:hypothetical protein [Sphingomonas xinjiangensis]|uniref:Uncharacterized protein n=1 Tax=Sphingomonas xinjiangensis TaxID=643568 RepID=A0A840YR49_9SPHN|nr:hypothetical protein [Sphingomonas xinjiangensis]MBB5711722.1 hypothetical protein [Sphingomonas xinjiangensis]
MQTMASRQIESSKAFPAILGMALTVATLCTPAALASSLRVGPVRHQRGVRRVRSPAAPQQNQEEAAGDDHHPGTTA